MQTFAGWVSLPENRSARTAVERVAQAVRRRKPQFNHNPLVLHGPAGTGKTHLVNALLAQVTQAVPDLVVTVRAARAFAPSGVFTADSPESTRAADLVAVEDLQHLSVAATEAFVHLVDQCRTRGQQLVVTASVGPAQIDQLSGRLSTRLSAGLVVRLDPLSPPSRLAFLRDRVERQGQDVALGVLEWLANHLPGSTRQLEAALGKLGTLGRLSGAALTPDALAEHFQTDFDARLTVETIAQRVGRYFRVEPKQMRSRGRTHDALVPRQVGMYLARRLTPLSLQEIGSFFGGRDHSTVLHACRKVEEALTHDPALSGAVHQLQADLT